MDGYLYGGLIPGERVGVRLRGWVDVESKVEQNRYAVVALPGNPFFIAV
jgi:hypothetical protein